ncbi:DpnII family type II restriction endonuclease [Thioflexithrix psekupsensis]|uniref:BanI/HgiCI C-terminal domain-containing protein n=1 Tax=Thioflexithrix psekupsensis TaxID=1570016 RepID=A0A251XB59_9GAMM|nr:DpnII family type II restriction endonuclease [Thioflexithrix psekupsensis]OUD15672.1 hypothetical protein TPSD3_03905 [Thioflexithrix psekupsensis]
MMSVEEKYQIVLDKNTFYFHDPIFEEKYESYINALNETLLVLKNKIETYGLKREFFEDLLIEKENGLKVLLALTGFSNESLKRLITVVRVSQNQELARLLFTAKWGKNENSEDIKEWTDALIEKMIKDNEFFRKGLINLFFEGSTVPYLAQTLPLFELKKLSISKLKFEASAMIDTLIRYKEKGSYSAQPANNPEFLIKAILQDLKIPFEKGDLEKFSDKESNKKREMDFVLPNRKNPQIIIESSFLVTTSSGQGDKSKTEQQISTLIKKYYPKAKFIGFVDGIGWYVRQEDLKRMVSSFDEVFTFHKDELNRFKEFLKRNLIW